MENGLSTVNSDLSAKSAQAGKYTTLQTKAKQSAGVSPAGHKRTLSGSVLSFPFFGESQSNQDVKSPSRTKSAAADLLASPRAAGGAMASAMTQQKKSRKRKGSLRKTALLGPGKVRLESKDEGGVSRVETDSILHASKEKTFQPSSNRHTIPLSFRTTSILSGALPKSENDIAQLPFTHVPTSPHLNSASTTDEDDLPPLASSLKTATLHSQDSYFPPQPRTYRPPPPSTSKSPLGSLPASIPSSPQEWVYSETRAWGWVLLVTTWIVFVVGMGSCFGVWSWAWDVGETPYAPPELEDDPTLPIVGYYPALIILTGVMAWVWVVVAWVGMKYFRHAKMNGEEE